MLCGVAAAVGKSISAMSHAGEIVARDAVGVVIVGAVQALRDGEIVPGRELLEQAAHFAVTDDGQVHGRGAWETRVSSCTTILL